ncbi:MAG: tetratricopeptide repeat protein [Bacteroidia bacterium]|nr:tetratricopeptide repeat protein [Bacteroidia bacterium]
MKNKIIYLVFMSIWGIILSQPKEKERYRELIGEGNLLLLEENYPQAIKVFLQARELDSTNANVNYNLGVAYLLSVLEKKKAEPYLAYAVKFVNPKYNPENPLEKTCPVLAHYYYGQALHLNHKFDEAIEQFDKFIKYTGNDKDWKKDAERLKKMSLLAKELIKTPVNIEIVNLGDSINTEWPEYSPVVTADEQMMVFTSRRPNTTGGTKDIDGLWNEDIYVSYKNANGEWSTPKSISENINGIGMEASIFLSPDGQTLIIYKDPGDGQGGNLYYSQFDGKNWSALKEFGSDVNSKYWESHACLSPDGNKLYFVSNRPGGYGGRDIYRVVKLPNGKWSKALNLGPSINSEYDEDAPFLHPDGKTFFFSSNGYNTMGGFDIMFGIIDENDKITDITNLGYPINTVEDDIFFTTSPDGKRAYFSSIKEFGKGEKDIYMLTLKDNQEKPLVLFKGMIIPAEGEKLPEDLRIVVRDKFTGEVVGSYKPRSNNGSFAIILPPGKEYTFSYQSPEGEEFYSEDIFVNPELSYQEINREVNLEPINLLGKVKAKSKDLILKGQVFDNPYNNKPVKDAIVYLINSKNNNISSSVDEKGNFSPFNLAANENYTIYAEYNNKKTQTYTFSTQNIKPPKIYNQVLYFEGKPGFQTINVNITVLDHNKNPIPNATVIFSDKSGNKLEFNTDENGKVAGAVPTGKLYEVYATDASANSSNVLKLNAKNVKEIQKTLIIRTAPTKQELYDKGEADYAFFFTYNKSRIELEAKEWKDFVSKVAELSKKGTVKMHVSSSASKVPTIHYEGNKNLAKVRGERTAERLKEFVANAGGNPDKLSFTFQYKVGGPKYIGDFTMRKKYEPHQFVKIFIKK